MLDLNYHHLYYFWVVARRGSISAACEELLVAQPTVSAQLRVLERALGEKLFQKRGRGLALTEVGRTVFDYANDIFLLGRELQQAVKGRAIDRPIRLRVGLSDAVPKLVACEILEPAIESESAVRMVVQEGKPADLLSLLATHRLDVVIADEMPTRDVAVRVYPHELGESTVSFVAAPKVTRRYVRRFPQSLQEAPLILPAPQTPMRRTVDRWFAEQKIEPRIRAECDDSAFANVLAGRGLGVVAIPSVVVGDVKSAFGLTLVGEAPSCRERFFLISAERRLQNPVVVTLTTRARAGLFRR